MPKCHCYAAMRQLSLNGFTINILALADAKRARRKDGLGLACQECTAVYVLTPARTAVKA